MMSDRNIFSATMSAALAPFIEIIGVMKWFFFLAAILIIVDLRFGVQAARRRGEQIKKSRAIRRTFNKAVDYICWIFLSGILGQAVGTPLEIPVLPVIFMLIIIGVELESCLMNYFEAQGKNVKINIWKIFGKKVSESIDIKKEEKDNDTNGTDTTNS
ncbi:MAG TPA: phage holin family protein [Bacteroidales bacterium]|nr:phage holin family protein [Bacteroidales bacterium]